MNSTLKSFFTLQECDFGILAGMGLGLMLGGLAPENAYIHLIGTILVGVSLFGFGFWKRKKD